MSTVGALTIYAILRDIDGEEVQDFDDVVIADKLDAPDLLTRDFETHGENWAARLYIWPGEPRLPAWVSFIADGFGDDLGVPTTAQSSAVIVVRAFFRRDRYYAVAFGAGRHAIKRNAVDPKYGLQVALNAIYKDDRSGLTLEADERVRQVEMRTVGANTMRTLRQANSAADFDEFELDPDADQLEGITGKPHDLALARRVRGTDSVRLVRTSSFSELGRLCRSIASYHERKNYRHRFGFVDNIKAETNAGLVADLSELAVTSFLSKPERWTVAPPDLLDYEVITAFEVPDLDILAPDVSSDELSAALQEADIRTADELSKLTIRALDGDRNVVDQWCALRCLDGQIELDGVTYLMDGGQYYEVAAGYIDELDAYIGGIERSTVELPPSVRVPGADDSLKEMSEGDYNEMAANSSPDFLLLDKELVTISSRTSAIEVCDVLTRSRQMVHVKRKFSSSSLSHLFAQGYVSSELLAGDPDYRKAIRNKIGNRHNPFRALFPAAGIDTSNFEIVYAIVAEWGDRELKDIPFFSKVNLRRHTRALRRMRYKVTYAAVQVLDPE